MRRVFICCALLGLTMTSGHRAMAKGKPPVLGADPRLQKGLRLARKVGAALSRQTRITVTGSLSTPYGAETYLLRYQAEGKESLQEGGPTFSRIQVGGHALKGIWAVSIGTVRYKSFDGTHWAKGTQSSPARPLDALSLGPAGVPCCVTVTNSAVEVMDMGATVFKGRRIERLSYKAGANGQFMSGNLYVDPQTHLPTGYTQSDAAPNTGQGAFAITYGGRFSISAP